MMTYQIQTSPATLMAVQGMMLWSKEGALPPQRPAMPNGAGSRKEDFYKPNKQ